MQVERGGSASSEIGCPKELAGRCAGHNRPHSQHFGLSPNSWGSPLGGPEAILSDVRSVLGRERSLDGGLGAVLGRSNTLLDGVRPLTGGLGAGCRGPGPVPDGFDPVFERRCDLDRNELLVGLALFSKFRVVVSKVSVAVALLRCVVALLCRSVALLRCTVLVSFSVVLLRWPAMSFRLVAAGSLSVAAGGLSVELGGRLVTALRFVVAVASSTHGTSQMANGIDFSLFDSADPGYLQLGRPAFAMSRNIRRLDRRV